MHHQWLPDVLKMEAELLKEHVKAVEKLRALGHAVDRKPAAQGDAHSIRVDPRTGLREGVADRRRAGWAAGLRGSP
jgi:gamma-glutamyltranspeptidase/glutathione hydrolase